MDYELKNKTAFVTGAKNGIGLAAAQAFAKAGANVALIDIIDASEEAEMLKKQGFEAVFIKADVSSESNVKSAVEKTVEIYGSLDAAFNNAGVQTPQLPMAQISNKDYDITVQVDLGGVWKCMKYEIEQMLKQGGGSIINTSSQGGVTGFPGQAAYIACKHAVIGLTRTAAIDYAKENIRVNAICPGAIKTPMAEELIKRNPEIEKELLRDIPMGRLGLPEEIAQAVLWLASPASSFLTGQPIIVDGGFTAH
ncbi:MAG: SDR family oxidoreductase [Mucispirillum sp.]|nr:SDR family oxidoreductase [Mucispirillum sp.]